jgi:hypothetical protein
LAADISFIFWMRTSSTINKMYQNYTEIREEWDNGGNTFLLSLEHFGELKYQLPTCPCNIEPGYK